MNLRAGYIRSIQRRAAPCPHVKSAERNPGAFKKSCKSWQKKQTCITGEIVEFTALAQSTISQHLKVLREAVWSLTEKWTVACYYADESGIRWRRTN